MTSTEVLVQLLTVLRTVEWSGGGPHCPSCGAFQGDGVGHRVWCDLAAAKEVAEAWCDAAGVPHPARLEQIQQQQEADDAAFDAKQDWHDVAWRQRRGAR